MADIHVLFQHPYLSHITILPLERVDKEYT